MNLPPEQSQSIFETNDPRECRELKLVLDSAGVSCRVLTMGKRHALVVAASNADRAVSELESYRLENASRSSTVAIASPSYAGAKEGVFAYVTIIVFFAALSLPQTAGLDLYSPGEMQAGRFVAGEWYRAITALTLHLDIGHVIGNLLFGSLFGYFAGRVLGGGLAWLTIVLAGAIGNAVNALIQDPDHTSIGVSTAVFAALGMLIAHGLRPRLSKNESLMRRWTPLVAGLMLFSLTGVGGERTDVMAHVTGFASGFVAGWIVRYASTTLISSVKLQAICGAAAIAAIGISWAIALR